MISSGLKAGLFVEMCESEVKTGDPHADSPSEFLVVPIIPWDECDETYCNEPLESTSNNLKSELDNMATCEEMGIPVEESYASYNDDNGNSLIIDGDSVSGHYDERFDINGIHLAIMKNFRDEVDEIPEMEEKVRKMNDILNSGDASLSGCQVDAMIKAIGDLKSRIRDAESEKSKRRYLRAAMPILRRYNNLDIENQPVDFFEDSLGDPNKPLSQIQKIIEEFLDIASEYISIDVIRDVKKSSLCSACGCDLLNAMPDVDGTFNCPGCGVEIEYVDKDSIAVRDTTSMKGHRNSYEDRINFGKAVINYQGKQEIKLPENLEKILDEHFTRMGIPIGLEIRKTREKDDYGRRIGTNLKMMIFALKSTGLSGHYENVNLIMNKYWGWDLPDISHLEEKIMADYDRSQDVFLAIKSRSRKSCLNAQYRLYRHLERLGHKCEVQDFKIVGTERTLHFHESCWEKICRKLDSPDPNDPDNPNKGDRWIFRSIV